MNKETTELAALIAKSVNAVFKSLEDGKLNLQDLGNFLDPVFAAQPAIDGIKLVGAENANMTIPEREGFKKGFHTSMPDVDESTRYDLTEVFSGLLSVYRVGYRLGQKAGEAAVIADIKAGRIPLESLGPDQE